jgi:sulfonate dioxygenase
VTDNTIGKIGLCWRILSTFGRLHIHPTSGQPKDYPEFHLVYRDAKPKNDWVYDIQKLSSTVWHSDVTYEQQPPGLTTLFLYDTPGSGGDTGYVSQVGEQSCWPWHAISTYADYIPEAYNRLSPSLRAYLETLSVVHSGVEQAEYSRRGNRGGVVKREPVENVHPLVRRHPVTGEKALFVNKQFSRRIVGLRTEESDAILNLL